MGVICHMRCSNKQCGYDVMLYEEPGVILAKRNVKTTAEIKLGKLEVSKEIKDLVAEGKHVSSMLIYSCPKCREWTSNDAQFVYDGIVAHQYAMTDSENLHFINGIPKCKKCGTNLIHVPNPKKKQHVCPKCRRGIMELQGLGRYD